MRFLPSDQLEIETTLSAENIAAALSSQIAPKKWFRLSRPPSDQIVFEGDLSPEGFQISRILPSCHHNSFLPVVTGVFLPGPSGVKVAVRLDLPPITTAIMYFVIVGFGFVFIGHTVKILSGQASVVSAEFFFPLLFIAFSWFMAWVGFGGEAENQKMMLTEMFQEMELKSSDDDRASTPVEPL